MDEYKYSNTLYALKYYVKVSKRGEGGTDDTFDVIL